jgi:P-type Ca2+ transporter type 2C
MKAVSLNHPWHRLAIEEVVEALDLDLRQGLASREVEHRLARYGWNRLAETPPRSLWTAFLDQFKSPLILVLLGAAVLAGSIGNHKDALVILVIVALNAALGFYQEYRAEQSLTALKKMLTLNARVRRDSHVVAVPTEALVPGDLVLLEAGDRVPADGRLVTVQSVEIDESALTGESQPVSKQVTPLVQTEVPLAERRTMAYMNTVLTRGRAEMVVTATGMQTEMGRLSSMLATAKETPTPLQIQLDLLGKRLGIVALLLISLLFVLEFLRGHDFLHILFDAIALAVAAIPEGLPAVVTVTLALGMRRIAHRHAIVKRLAGVETLGCTTVICSDKTGTLTVNQMTARAVFYRGQEWIVTGEGYTLKEKSTPQTGLASSRILLRSCFPWRSAMIAGCARGKC